MQALTLEIIMRAVFGTRDERLRALLAQLLDWMGDPLPADARRAGRRADDRRAASTRMRSPVDALLNEEIARRRTAPDLHEREDILSMLLSTTDMDDRDAARRAADAARRRPRDDGDRAELGARAARPSPGGVGAAARERRDYLDAVCKETLRLRPVVPAVLRMLKAPFEVARLHAARGRRGRSRTSC